MTYELRAHQIEAINDIAQSFRSGHQRPILQAACGFGKTLLAIDIIKRAVKKMGYVVFVVDRIQLIDQTSKEFDKHGIEHGIIQGDHWRRNHKRVQIASVQTLVKRKMLPRATLFFVDECHAVYASFIKLITQGEYKDVPVIGLSATPFSKGLGKTYDDLVLSKTTAWLIENGYLCNYTAYGAPIDLSGIKTTAGDYNPGQLDERVRKTKIVGDVVTTWLRLGQNRQTICFAVSVAHSEAIVSEFRANGVTAEHIDAYTESEERDEILSRHESGEIKIVSNVGILTKGWDSPQTDCLIVAVPTKSLMKLIQIFGRILRVSKNRTDAIILDHGGNIERLGYPDDQLPEYLCNGDKNEAEAQKKDREEKITLPTACEKCYFLSDHFVCPQCGHKPAVVPKVEAVNGQLKKLEKVAMKDKSMWFGMLLGHARSKGYSDGWASHKYRDKFDVWPAKKTGIAAVSPNQEVKNWIKSRQIAAAKRKPSSEKVAKQQIDKLLTAL